MRRSSKAPKKIGMAPQRVLGICLLVAGIIILAIGVASNNASTAKLGLPNSWFVLGGISITLVGFILTVLGLRSRGTR
jgi:hypothetical protein